MKKHFYLLTALTLSTGVVLAQTSREQKQLITKKGYVELAKENKAPTTQSQKGDEIVLWENGFEDASEWDFYDESIPEPLGWEIITDPTVSPVAALNPILLDGVEDGFAYINGDPAGDGSQQNAWIEYGDPVEIDGAENVSLVFDQVTRNFATTYFVDISTDDGNSWIPIQVNVDLEVNTNTENPEVFTLNLTDVVGGLESFRFRFNFLADWGWFWAVDNVRFIETPANDVVLNGAWYDEHILIGQEAYLDVDYIPELEYSEYRQNHVRPFTFVADVSNQGSGVSTDITFIVDVTTPDGMETYMTSIDELQSGEDTVLTIDNVLLNAFDGGGSLGDYSVDFRVEIAEDDALPENNFAPSKSFIVGTERMANDGGEGYTGWYNDLAQGTIWGNQFTVEEETEINYLQFALVDATDDITQIGEEIFVNFTEGSVLDDEDEPVRYFDEDELSYIISDGDVSIDGIANYITIMLESNITLVPGVVYQAEVEVPEVGSPIATIPVSNGQEGGAGVLFDFLNDPAPQWFTLGANAPNVRAGFDGPTSTDNVAKLDFSMDQNFPNPVANGSTRISWELRIPAENITFAIFDNTGKMIYQKDMGDRPAGVQEDIVLDNLNLAAGVYQYGIKVGNNRIVRKMVITK